jgi:hypothetical protein
MDGQTDGCGADQREEGGEERLTGVAQLVPDTRKLLLPMIIIKSDACAEMSGTPRPSVLHKSQILQGKNGSGQVTAEYALVQVTILGAETLEEGGHSIVLVHRALKIVRETAPGHARRDLGLVACRTADAGNIGTCETVAIW